MDLYMMKYKSGHVSLMVDCIVIASNEDEAIMKIKEQDKNATEIKVKHSKVIPIYAFEKATN